MRLNTLLKLLAAPALALLMACGGAATGPGPQAAPSSVGFAYTDPQGGDWTLVRNASSTDTHLILDLVGPTGTKFRGVGFNLKSDGSVTYGHMGAGGYVRDTGVFHLQSTYANYPVEPVLLAGGVKGDGKLLTVGIFQKDRYWPSVSVNKPVCQISIDFDATKTASLPPGTKIPLAITKAKAIPSYIGTMPADPSDLNGYGSVMANFNSSLVPVQISVGTLVTK
ncbi:MAG TPA: hypothetical protein VJ623_11980 [Holophagaceae bacterium]|nr:hypothetical protein [Holophagaceae bacterium]